MSILSKRENEVLLLIADGKNTNEIAEELHLSPHTIHVYVRTLLVALDAHTRAHAVALAYHRGILTPRVTL